MVTATETIADSMQNVWQAATKLSSCRQLLTRHFQERFESGGALFELDDRKFTQAFFAWTQILEESEFYLYQNAPDYFQFSIGALLAELLRANAIRAIPIAPVENRKPTDNIAHWWPTGYALTQFCIELLRKVYAQECGNIVSPSKKIKDIKVWQSFRENLLEEPSIAIAYFDNFMGISPNWRNPCYAGHRTMSQS